jgi:hypothetical protein
MMLYLNPFVTPAHEPVVLVNTGPHGPACCHLHSRLLHPPVIDMLPFHALARGHG